MEGRRVSFLFVVFIFLFSACTAPKMDGNTLEGKKAILDAVDLALTREDCATAITQIEGLYGSTHTDNEVRLARAAAQGCAGGSSNMIRTLETMVRHADVLLGPGFWEFLSMISWEDSAVKLGSKTTASNNAVDALFSATIPGRIIAVEHRVNDDTPNVGSIVAEDRIDDANLYLMFVSMSLAGTLQNRFGAPTVTYKRGQLLGETAEQPEGWTRNDNVNDDACTYASSLLNLMDAIDSVGGSLEREEYSQIFRDISGTLAPILDSACDAACRGEDLLVVDYGEAGCAFNTDHDCKGTERRPCMLALRDRRVCTSLHPLAAKAKCAAAGIALLVSKHMFLGWQP